MLHWKWLEYEALFGSGPERIELLNSAASGFFWLVQACLWENLLVHIARMISSPRSAGKDNLSLKRLPTLVSSEIRLRVETLIDDAAEKCKFACDWRNRHIAHRDLGLALEQSSVPLVPASREFVREALAAIAAVLNCLDIHYCHGRVNYESFEPPGSAEVLIRVLREGVEARNAHIPRLL
jgi:hypothetical protein